MVIAAFDGYGHVVSGVIAGGYLTHDRIIPALHAQFDGFLLGQPVIVSTGSGPVHGVVAQPGIHLLTPERQARNRWQLRRVIIIDLVAEGDGAGARRGQRRGRR